MKRSSIGALKEAFWAKFSTVYWEQKPVCLKNPVSLLHEITSDHIFRFLVRYSSHCRKTGTTDGIKFYIDGELQYMEDILRVLPEMKDKSLRGYHSRMKKRFSDYCLVCDELLQVSLEKWDVLRTFMQDLYKHVGIPTRFAEIGLYLGNYRKTPFGVHVDGCGVLTLPVVGTKRVRLWKPEFAEKNPDLKESFSYGAYKKHSTLLVAKPGDILYWPSSYWHIAESTGSFSATWSIGVWLDQPYSEVFMEILRPMLSKQLGAYADARSIPFQNPYQKDGRVERLPMIFNRSISLLLKLRKNELRITLLKFWLKFASKQGFKNVPMVNSKTPLGPNDQVLGKSSHPILWAPVSIGRLCLAVNGALLDVPNSPRVVRMIRALNSGKPCKVSQFSMDSNILKFLYQAHGIEKVKAITDEPPTLRY